MVQALEVKGAAVVIRPVRSTVLIWMLVFTTALSWMFWKFLLYEVHARSAWLLVCPGICLLAVLMMVVDRHTRVITINRDRDLVLLERRPFLVFPSRQQRHALSDFEAVGSCPLMLHKSAQCCLVLVSTDMRSLELQRAHLGSRSDSFWRSRIEFVEPEQIAATRKAVAQVAGLTNLGFVDDDHHFKRRYKPLED